LKEEKEKVKDIRETPEVRRAQAELTDAEQRYKRVRNLVDQGIASQADLDQAQARFRSLQAAYDATMELLSGPLPREEAMENLAQLTPEGLAQLEAERPDDARELMQQVRRGT